MKTTRAPGPLTPADKAWWLVFQREHDLQDDGIVGTQTTAEVAITLGEYERKAAEQEKHINRLYAVLAVVLLGGAGVWGAM